MKQNTATDSDTGKRHADAAPQSGETMHTDNRQPDNGQPENRTTDSGQPDSGQTPPGRKPRRQRRRFRWLRVTLRVLLILILVVLLIPVLLYIPPVQTGVVRLATRIVRDKTGMDVNIGKMRLKFPLDVSLSDVTVVEASGDTMVNAREVVADVRLMPLLKLDVQLNRLLLRQGYYRFLSPDSSMLIKIRAGYLEADDKSSMNIASSRIIINKARMTDADVSLYMNVWKQKPTPPDTTSTPFYIAARDIEAERVRFAMSMLPTIDTLTLLTDRLRLLDGIIDLSTNDITASLLTLSGGDARYIAPTPEYVAAHPAPAADTTAVASPPMTIKADSVSLSGFSALYAIKGAEPLPGFDANYIQVSDVAVGLRHFYNQAASLRLPLTHVYAKERSGLQIVEGSGLLAITEAGLSLDGMQMKTPFSQISGTADLPFALMQLEPQAPVNARVEASIGLPDVDAFMPSLKVYTAKLPRQPINARLAAEGRLDNVEVKALDVAMPAVFSLRAKGNARNALDVKHLVASLTLDGELQNPSVAEAFAGELPVKVPPLKISGTLGADRQTYRADVSLVTPQGGVLADGHASLTSEAYDVALDIDKVNAAYFMPDLGVGMVSGRIHASGAGFNPTVARAHSDIDAIVKSITYNGRQLSNITLGGTLQQGRYTIDLDSPNEDLNLSAHITGTLAPDDYCAEGMLRIYNADLHTFGFMETTCYGSADFEFDVTAHPERWLYDAQLDFHSISWHMDAYDLDIPDGLQADFIAEADNVHCTLTARGTEVDFTSPTGLQPVAEGFTKAIDVAMAQIEKHNLDVEEMQTLLPPFSLTATATGRGIVKDFLTPTGMVLDSVAMSLSNDSLIRGHALVSRFNTGSVSLDTITLALKERGKLIDYRLHLGNRPGTLDELAQADINGYLGSNRISAFATQKNLAGKTGYRLGFTAAVEDSTMTLHFTPLRATIAYIPWTFNDDNHVDYTFSTRRVNANLKASSRESSLLLMTEPNPDGDGEDLHLNVANIHVQDFLQLSVLAPPVKATVDGDLRVNYDGKTLNGKGNISVDDFIYDKMMVGDFDLGLNAGVDFKGESVINADMSVNGHPALALKTVLEQQPNGLEPRDVNLSLTHFPLKIANAFLGADVAKLSGELNGTMEMTGSLSAPLLNGSISVDSVSAYIPMMGSALRFESNPLTVADNEVRLSNFNIFGANRNPLSINGVVDARDFANPAFDITAAARDFQLINNDRRARSDLYGKVFLNLDASVKGPMKHFDVNANLNVLGGTDATYNVDMSSNSTIVTTSDDVVKFVSFADSIQVVKADTVPQMMAMRIRAGLTVTPGARITVNLGSNGKVQLQPSGTVNAYRNFMGDMSLNGQLYLGEGFANYKFPGLGSKDFTFDPQSSVTFNGDMMNPTLNIKATDVIKANVVNSSGNSNLVNFLVGLSVTQTLASPKVVFDLSTDDDLSLQNELQSMSADQRSTQAMNLLLTGIYQGNGIKTASGNMADNMLYGFLESQLNNWAAKTVRGVDLSFGIDNYNKSVDGVSSNTMSYSYQVSKSLFNNRFKIVVGGNYSTDASADENLAQNLISDVSFEYTLKQTNSLTMLVRLFRHVGYESVLEGEVTEMGVGFAMRRRLGDLRRLFRVRWGKRRQPPAPSSASSPEKSTGLSPEEIREVREEVKRAASDAPDTTDTVAAGTRASSAADNVAAGTRASETADTVAPGARKGLKGERGKKSQVKKGGDK